MCIRDRLGSQGHLPPLHLSGRDQAGLPLLRGPAAPGEQLALLLLRLGPGLGQQFFRLGLGLVSNGMDLRVRVGADPRCV